ncbi:MAG: amidohydrolase family protein [Clostridia bacterium]|nr:amidohydrolase family protein [Clostridia bacterium]
MLRIYKNAKVITPDGIRDLCVLTRDGVIESLCMRTDAKADETIDCCGMFLSPGFADIHVHGGGGHTAMGTPEDIRNMCLAHAKHGVTSIVPTVLTAPIAQMRKAADNIAAAAECSGELNILGAHLEGPFLSPKKSGAQSKDSIILPKKENLRALLDGAKQIVMLGMAPELPGAMEAGEYASSRGIVVSVAHSDADFETAETALDHGFSDVTHIFSACSAMHKEGIFRKVGVAEAGLALDGYTTQFIGDLRHLPVGAIKLIYKAKGAEKAYLISDGLEYSACDMPEGSVVTQENGQTAVIEDGVMKLVDRSCIAGSVTTLDRMVGKTVKECGIPLTDAVRMASLTPLSVLGLDNKKGMIRPGYDEDLILFDENVQIDRVWIRGKEFF